MMDLARLLRRAKDLRDMGNEVESMRFKGDWMISTAILMEGAAAEIQYLNDFIRQHGLEYAPATSNEAALELESVKRDAKRYRRLRVIGVAPYGTRELEHGLVGRFTNVDEFVDKDIADYPTRGESEHGA